MVSWQSKKQATVTLSSTEAEYIGVAECCQDGTFIAMLLEETLKQARKMKVFCDNTGAIYLCVNQQVGTRTKHIDVKWHFIRELIAEGKLEVKFVGTEDNPADIFTKNVPENIFSKVRSQMVSGRIECWREDVKG